MSTIIRRSWRTLGGGRVSLLNDRIQVTGLKSNNSSISRVVDIVSPAESLDRLLKTEKVLIIHFPDRRRHPAGEDAQISWFNDAGDGLLRFEDKKLLLLLPLRPAEGQAVNPNDPYGSEQDGKPGPRRTSDMWALVAALCSPRGWFDIERAHKLTGLSKGSLRPSLVRLRDAGFLEIRQLPSDQRQLRYRPILDDPVSLEEYLVAHWPTWRSGAGTAKLRATYRYFVPEEPWRLLAKVLGQNNIRAWPTGVTYLEGGPLALDNPTISTGLNRVELDLYVMEADMKKLQQAMQVGWGEQPMATSAGRVCIVQENNHPVACLVSERQATGLYATPWPWGLAALDALDHADARVVQEAKRWLRKWLDNQMIEQQKDMR